MCKTRHRIRRSVPFAASDFIVHTLTVFEGAEAAALDCAEVSEHVVAALLWSWATTDLLTANLLVSSDRMGVSGWLELFPWWAESAGGRLAGGGADRPGSGVGDHELELAACRAG
jgi:hypothetical protein